MQFVITLHVEAKDLDILKYELSELEIPQVYIADIHIEEVIDQ